MDIQMGAAGPAATTVAARADGADEGADGGVTRQTPRR
jgi:hypothetical protein